MRKLLRFNPKKLVLCTVYEGKKEEIQYKQNASTTCKQMEAKKIMEKGINVHFNCLYKVLAQSFMLGKTFKIFLC